MKSALVLGRLTRLLAAMGMFVMSTAAFAVGADGQTDLEHGVAMARQNQWTLALRYFHAANDAAPDDSAPLLNLGLAYDRMGNHEAQAIAWLRAYLAAAPMAANAQQARDRIRELDTALEIKAQHLLDVASRSLEELSEPAEKANVLAWIMRVTAQQGDSVQTHRLEQTLPYNMISKAGWAIAGLAAAQARQGNFIGALNDVKRLGDSPLMQSWTRAEIAVEQAKQGDFADAVATAQDIRLKHEAAYALSRIAILRARSGDAAGAEATANRIDGGETGAAALARAAIAASLASKGDKDGATRLLSEVDPLVPHIADEKERMMALYMVATAKAELSPDLPLQPLLAGLNENIYRDRALRDVAMLRGDAVRAAIFHWTLIAHELENDDALNQIQFLSDIAKRQPPAQSAILIAKSAYELACVIPKARE